MSTQFSPKGGTTLASKRKVAFEPPQGAVLMGDPGDDTGVIDTGEFDWDSVKDSEDIELWLVRVPNSVRLFFNPSPLLPTFPTGLAIDLRFRLVFIPGVPKGTLTECLLSEIFFTSRSNPNISTMPFSMLPPRLLHTPLVRSRGNMRHTTSGPLVTATTMMSIMIRLAATR